VKGRIFLAQWDAGTARDRAKVLRSAGWCVEAESADGWLAYSRIRIEPPDAVVIDLARKPSHGRELGRSLRYGQALQALAIVFVDGDERDRALARVAVSDARFTSTSELAATLDVLRASHADVGVEREATALAHA
jgi:DNA-binding response OmpR family regulator